VERLLGLVLATPTIHRVHHSALRAQTDSNYGGGLIVWDRLFGTYRNPEVEPVERIGLGSADDALANSLAAQLLLPLKAPMPDAAGGEPPLADRTQIT
jgi:sterol desaturase/sphingolipid hydroxylase (fatty acid hydroxylase superfamily)